MTLQTLTTELVAMANTLMKDKFVRGGPHELADGRDKWFRLSQKYAEDAGINHERLNNLMEAWKNSTIKQVVQSAPTNSQVNAAIRQSKKFADRKSDYAEIMAIAERYQQRKWQLL